ncbi:MAG: hypothetical protein ACREVR_10370 [Burkholderiales bacterium]
MKTTIEKLFTSPDGKGFKSSPFVLLMLGVGFMVLALHGAYTGELIVGRYTQRVVSYAATPRFFVLSEFLIFALGAFSAGRGWRRFRRHDD